jgi:Rieske Fe-S protein
MTRREWLQATAMSACAPCACLAGVSNDCCTLPDVAPDAMRIEPGRVVIDVARAPQLGRMGGAVKIVDPARKLQILVARPGRNEFVALDQKCTHGGGPLTYVHRHKHLYCTCWGHSKFALDDSVLRWPNAQTPRPLRTHTVEHRGGLLYVHVEGLV